MGEYLLVGFMIYGLLVCLTFLCELCDDDLLFEIKPITILLALPLVIIYLVINSYHSVGVLICKEIKRGKND